MENILRKPYEISLWDDDLTFKVTYLDSTGAQVAVKEYIGSLANFEPIEGTTTEVVQYYKERKICIIGSNTMDTPIRATSGKLVSNVNGSNTLTFNMYSKYYDEESEEFYDNPFLKLLVNERKVKLRYGALNSEDCKWYDFIIKEVKENSENKTFSYICKDLFINELSKSGFNIQLDPELENNMGNITTLAEVILDESDWRLGENNDVISQAKEEPLYEIKLGQAVTAYNMKDKQQIDIPIGQVIYAFYSIIANQEPYFQFVYRTDGKYEVDDDRVITNSPNYFIENVQYTDEGLPSFAELMNISSIYRGEKLIRQAVTFFDSTINRYVNVYDKNGEKYYGFTKTEYITPTAVQTFITNGEGFSSDNGWKGGGYWKNGDKANIIYPNIELVGYPDIREIEPSEWDKIENYRSFIKFKRTNEDQVLFNSGFADHRSAIKSLAVDEKFVIRAKISKLDENSNLTKVFAGEDIKVIIAEYTLEQGKYILGTQYFTGASNFGVDDWLYFSVREWTKSLVSKSYSDLINTRVGIFFKTPLNIDYYFENVQFFRYIEYDKPIKNDKNEITGYEPTMAEPGGELFSTARTKYIYYLPNADYKSEDDMIPEYDGYVDNPDFVKKYNENQFEKIRSITASESNRFNLIQDLCEIFECWAKFEIEHNLQTGEILLDEEYRQKKWITFHEYIGKDNYAGFRYGINLKSIQRTLNSDDIVSKIVVKNNANEFAPNGFCSISRATENPTGENFILNFDYYIHQDLIDFSEVNNDLYLDTNGYIGYYKKLKALNQNREAQINLQAKLLTDISQYEANYQTYKLSVEAAQEELRDTEVEIERLTGSTLAQLKADSNNSWWNDTNLIIKINKVAQLNSLIRQHSVLRDKEQVLDEKGLPFGGRLYEAEQQLIKSNEYIKELAEQKKALNLRFYKKYSRFIQEGSWISEDYTDENLYYLDAESTLFTSAQPKVTYTINVLELSQLEGYENYTFALGDKTYIEDTEFFGWVWNKNGVRTPYHEEIVVSEFTVELDSPEKNTFKVQNFKTQFEDLFQRITATTQSVEYHTGEYTRASSIVQTDGTIAAEILQNSMANNAIRLENAKDQSVVWDETGITTTSLSNPSEIIRIVSGGVFLSTDGGATWNTGITGSGINANFITAGQINTSVVNIMSGNVPSFRWDNKGLSAFEFSIDEVTGKPYAFNTTKFVRYDQYGLYGIRGQEGFDPLEKDSEGNIDPLVRIKEYANFSLTWDGFQIKSTQREGGYISITEDNDLQVFGKSEVGDLVALVTIGQLDDNGRIFGLRMKNANNQISLEQTNDGKLWLRDSISIGATGSAGAPVQIGLLADEQVFNANNGTFIIYKNGRVEAQEGSFKGNISAQTGEIGGFKIENGVLYSTENQEASSEENAKIVLDGLTGSLVAKKGFIGGFKISGTMLCSTEGSSAGEEKIRLDGANGTGHFQGEIVAQSGIIGGFLISNNYLEARTGTLVLDGWSGEIKALKGTIGGFQINNNYIDSQNYDSLRKGIRLDGQNALIRLGAEQEQEIQLLGLEGKIIVKSKAGSASSVFDSITIDAKTGSMYSYQYGSGLTAGWYIDSNEAIFNNITARGSIKASVFEYGEVQAVGGILLIRPSTRILSQLLTESQNEFTFKVESAVGFKAKDLCLITPASGKQVYFIISEIKDEQDYKILKCQLQSDYSDIGESNFSGMPIVNLGQPRDVGIGINASTIGDIIEPQSISVFELGENTQLKTHIILGKIPQEEIYGDMAGSYGLFADKVHLSGSLTTSNDFGYSSGIRTTPREEDKKIISIHFDENNGEILLWAGAIDETAGSIQNANFYVNEKGYLHANGAHFSGSVLSDAIITASEIKTAIITGTGKDAALLIKDAYTGIVFSGEKLIEKGSETLFKIIGKTETYSVDESVSAELIKSYIDELSSSGFIISGSISKNKLEEIDNFDSSIKEMLLDGGIQYQEAKYQNKTFFQVAKDNFVVDTSSIELKGEIYTSGSLNLGEYVNGFEPQLILSTDGIKKNGNNLFFDEDSIVIEIANNAAMSVDPTNLMINKKLTVSQGISYQDDAAYVPVKNSNNEVVGYNLYVY